MTIGEANQFNTLMRHMLDVPMMGKVPDEAEALAAACALADRANMALGAGLTAAQIEKVWKDEGMVRPT